MIATAACPFAAVTVAQDMPIAGFVPFLPDEPDQATKSLIRIVNVSEQAGSVRVSVINDAAGLNANSQPLEIGARQTLHFDSSRLSELVGVGASGVGQRYWRVLLRSDLQLEPRAYARTNGAFAELHESVRGERGLYRVAMFNPGSNLRQVSLLRLVNVDQTGVAQGAAATITIRGTDDAGASPGPGVTLDLPPSGARTFTAAELESGGAPGLTGSLGDGLGKWRLDIESSEHIWVMSLLASPTGHLTNLSTGPSHQADGAHRVPVFPPMSDPLGRQGFARVINHSDSPGQVRIEAFNATVWTYDPLTLTIGANETVHFNSEDLELGNARKGLTGSTGAGEGDWRLELTSDLDIEVLSYIRKVGGYGYVTPMHDTAVQETGGRMRYYVPVFHPASYEGQESRLHLLNLGDDDVRVGVTGLDDSGRLPPEGDVSLVLGSGESRVLTADQLENGGAGLDGRFGHGVGHWQLFISAGGKLQVMGLGYSPDGFVANLSRGAPPAPRTADPNPDLVVEALSASDTEPAAGASFVLSATVRNQGDGASQATTLRYYRSINATVSAADVEVGAVAVGELTAFGTSDVSLAEVASPEPGTYYYGACVDEVFGELDNANNCSESVEVRVPSPPGHPDLVVGSPSVSNSEPATGETFALMVTVRNSGDATAASTTLHYYRSVDDSISTTDTAIGTDSVIALGASGSSTKRISIDAPTAPGTHYYGACVEAVAEEANTSNNCSRAVAVTVPEAATARPDLVVESPSVSDSEPVGGAAFTLSVTVRNAGDAAAAATTLHYYRSADAGIAATDALVGSHAVDALGASDSSPGSLDLIAPSDPGTHYYGACVEAVAEEANTSNNCSRAVAVTVPEAATARPDLVVESPSVSDSEPVGGAAFTLSVTVRNAGDAAAAATTLHYYRSADARIAATDALVGSHAVVALGASDSSPGSLGLVAPTAPGTHYYGACVVAVAEEANTANNCSRAVAVTVPEAATARPDLVVESPSVSDSEPVGGAAFTLSVTVRNAGDAAAAATTLNYYRSADAGIAATDALVGSHAVDALRASDSSPGSLNLVAPSDPGTHYYGACAEAVADETDTSNNCSNAVRITVRPPPRLPDLVVLAPRVDNETPTVGERFTLRADVQNVGSGRSQATTVRFYRSTDAIIDTRDMEVGDTFVRSLGSSALFPRSIDLYAPLSGGTHYYGACVDAVPDESDTENNCSTSVAINVPEPANIPDLAMGAGILIRFGKTFRPGGSLSYSLGVSNHGDGTSDPTTLRYYRSSDPEISAADTQVSTHAIAALVPNGSSDHGGVALTAPGVDGTYYYGGCVDVVPREVNTDNNCFSPGFTVVVKTPSPDLVVTSISVDDSNPDAGGQFTLSATVSNQGDARSAPTTLRYFRSDDAAISVADTQVDTSNVPGLLASDDSQLSATLTAPSQVDTLHYGACVDGVANESDTANNCSEPVEVTFSTSTATRGLRGTVAAAGAEPRPR